MALSLSGLQRIGSAHNPGGRRGADVFEPRILRREGLPGRQVDIFGQLLVGADDVDHRCGIPHFVQYSPCACTLNGVIKSNSNSVIHNL